MCPVTALRASVTRDPSQLLRPDPEAPYVDREAEGQWEALLHDKLQRQWREHFPRNPLSRRGFLELTALQRVRLRLQ